MTSPSPNDFQAPPTPSLPLYAPQPPVTRINRRMVMGLFGLGCVLGVIVLVIGFADHRRRAGGSSDQDNAQRPNGPLEATRDLPKDYSFDVRQAAAKVSYETGAMPIATVPVTTRPQGPSPEELAALAERQRLAELRRQLLEQQRKEMEKALDSSVLFASAQGKAPQANAANNIAPPATPVAASTTQPPLWYPGYPLADSNSLIPTGVRQNLQSEKEAFLTKGNDVEPYLKKPLLEPLSAYEVKAGTVIPGALVTAINTDLPGEIIGQVTQNVFDTRTGRILLIPQGAKLLGKYSSLISNGQNRALIVWTRLILPNGDSIVLEGMPGTDGAGQAGVKDKVDYHMFKIASAVGLTTAIAYGGNLARSPRSGHGGSGDDSRDVIGDTVAQQANRVGEKFIDRELDVQPTIMIRSGWPFNVLVNRDMVLKPYRDEKAQ